MDINKPISAITIFIVTLVLVSLFVYPKYQESVESQNILIGKEPEYNNKSEYFTKILNILKDLNERQDALKKVDSALPSGFSFAPLVYFLQQKSSENGLIITSISFSQISQVSSDRLALNSPKQQIKDINFRIDLLGGYQGLKNFLYSLEKSARLLEVNTISFASLQSLEGGPKSQNQLQIYDFKLDLRTHTY